MQSEYTSLIGLGTWTLVPRKPGDKVIGSMWAYKIKENADGSINKLKSRLVARGDEQGPSTYSEIFAPVIKFVTLRARVGQSGSGLPHGRWEGCEGMEADVDACVGCLAGLQGEGGK